jgi:hypothetical protein
VLGLESHDPPIDHGPRHVQKPANTHLVPALRVEFDHLKAGLVAVGMGRGLPQRQGFLCHHRTLLPQLLGGLMVDVVPELAEHNNALQVRSEVFLWHLLPGGYGRRQRFVYRRAAERLAQQGRVRLEWVGLDLCVTRLQISDDMSHL